MQNAYDTAIHATLGAILEDAQRIVKAVEEGCQRMSSKPGDANTRLEAVGCLMLVEAEINRLKELKDVVLKLNARR